MADLSPSELEYFRVHVESGLYEETIKGVKALNTTALGAAEYKAHFECSVVNWSGNTKYMSIPSGNEIRFNVFGQIASYNLGTRVSASGNHNNSGSNGEFLPITDATKVKDFLVLECPSLAPDILSRMFSNQIATCNEVRGYDEAEEHNAGEKVFVKEIVKCSQPESEEPVGDMLGMHMPVKYTVPSPSSPASNSTKQFKRIGKQTLDAVTSPGSTALLSGGPAALASTNVQIPSPEMVKMGATYNANLLPDHISPAFNPDNKHMLIQHDIRDAADKLVAPWDVPAILRPGALVLANVSMHMFKFKTNGRRDRKLYQLHAHKVVVLAPSPLPPAPPPPIVATPMLSSSKPAPKALEESVNADAAFTNFRKRKIEAVESPSVQGNANDDANEVVPGETVEMSATPSTKSKGKKRDTGDNSHAKIRRMPAGPSVSMMEE